MKPKLAKILSSLRREAGNSQRQVAFDLGVSQALLSHYENGAREPKLEFVIKARLLRCHCGLYPGTDE
jgi:transcriptional regulator with XRE-family HTH domain